MKQSGDKNLTALTRTRWINSRAGINDEPPARFSAGVVIDKENRTLTTWSTVVTLSKTGLPSSIMRRSTAKDLFAEGKTMSLLNESDRLLHSCGSIAWGAASTFENVTWMASCPPQVVRGSIDADGTMLFHVEVTGRGGGNDDNVGDDNDDIRLTLPFSAEQVPFMMGLGKQGGFRPPLGWQWRWWEGTIDHAGTSIGSYANNVLWLGSTEHGLRLKMVGQGEPWLGALYRVQKPPSSWAGVPLKNAPPVNVGGYSLGLLCVAPNCTVHSGGANVSSPTDEGVVEVTAFRGSPIPTNTMLEFSFELLLTPSVSLNTSAHFGDLGRIYQYEPSPTAHNASFFIESGVKVVNVHQGVEVLNPYINYPFEESSTGPLSKMASELHAVGSRMKLYYTTRELSDHAQEIWMLKALRQEVLDGPGATPSFRNTAGASGGASWLQEHLDSHYSVCWSTPSDNVPVDGMMDAAVCDNGDSHQRWSNYYVQGLEYLVTNAPHMDGLYLDGISFDRNTMKRCRKVMDAAKEGCLIDLHSGDNFDPVYGGVSPALQYMHLMPYMDSTMFGEGYQHGYDQPAGVLDGGGPDWWLIEVSALPFGMMNDMLGQSKSQLWRGMVFGCVTRLPYSKVLDNQQVWKIWDDWKLKDAVMSGWWESSPAVRTVPAAGGRRQQASSLCGTAVVATSYVISGKHTLVAVASWANTTVVCDFVVDWEQIGFNASSVTVATAPAVPAVPIPSTGFFFQNASAWKVTGGRVQGVAVEPMRGWVFVLQSSQ